MSYLDKSGAEYLTQKLIGHIPSVALGTCSTAAATAAKVVTISSEQKFKLEVGAIIAVKSTVSNTASSVTLNVNGTGAKPIWYNTAAYTSNSTAVCGAANRYVYYIYDGTYWVWINYGTLDGNNIPASYCSTAAATAAKTASHTSYVLTANTYTLLTIANANTSKTALTLNINSKGAKPIYINGTASSTTNYTLPAGTYLVYYDGTAYQIRTDGKIPNVDSGGGTSSVKKLTNTVVAASAWVANSGGHANAAYKASITVSGVTASDVAEVIFSREQVASDLYDCYCETAANAVIIFAREKPTASITIPTIIIM